MSVIEQHAMVKEGQGSYKPSQECEHVSPAQWSTCDKKDKRNVEVTLACLLASFTCPVCTTIRVFIPQV